MTRGGAGDVPGSDEQTELEALRPVEIRAEPRNAEAPASALVSPVTPVRAFYVRTNFGEPALDADVHRVSVEGAVARGGSFTADELRALGVVTHRVTLECAGNGRLGMAPLPEGEPWRDHAVSTADFTGVPLRRLLERVGLAPAVVEICFEGADHGERRGRDVPFARALPIAHALHPDTLLALEMNGEPLTREHGAPVRLVVPGWYGMASVKWLRRIEARTTAFAGHFQQERYVYVDERGGPPTPVTTMRVSSLVTSPGPDARLARAPLKVRGKAWSGEGEIVAVDVSLDGGPWQPARVLASAGPYAWREFEWDGPVLEPGRHSVRSRATDAAGQVQPDRAPWNKLGYGNNMVRLRVFDVV